MNQLPRKIRTQAPIALATLAGSALLLIGSPLLLTIVNALFALDWARLNEIGQSYTGVATLLSGVALVGVAYSIRLQTQQISLARGQAVREMQFALWRMSMDDPALQLRTPLAPGPDPVSYRRQMYYSQWFRYLEFAYVSNEIDDSVTRAVFEHDLFINPDFRERWADLRTHWDREIGGGPNVRRRFFSIVDSAYAAAVESASSGDAAE